MPKKSKSKSINIANKCYAKADSEILIGLK